MQEICVKIDKKKRGIENLILQALVKAKSLEYPHFPEADKLRKCTEFLQKANHELFMAMICLMENRDVR